MQSSTILLIESEPILAECTGFRLELLGYRVDTVGTAEAARNYLDQQLPDLLLLNLDLADQPGLQFVEQLTNNASLAATPILALSLAGEIETVQKAFQAGIWDLLLIPYDPTVLEEKVRRLLAEAKRGRDDKKQKKTAAVGA